MKNNYNLTKLLLEHRANTECFIKTGMTPLYLAALGGYENIIELIVRIWS